MSRDTRLDEALDNLQTLNAQYYGLTEADRQGRRGLEIYHKRITARRAIEELFEFQAEQIKLAESIILSPESAASLSVSPVPSEPPRISARMARALLTLGFKGDEQGWPDYEGRTQAILVLRCISNSPAADSPVPEPSAPQK